MSSIYRFLDLVARRFFVSTGIPVPGFARRAHRVLRRTLVREDRRNLREDVSALARAVERLETKAYLEGIGRPPD